MFRHLRDSSINYSLAACKKGNFHYSACTVALMIAIKVMKISLFNVKKVGKKIVMISAINLCPHYHTYHFFFIIRHHSTSTFCDFIIYTSLYRSMAYLMSEIFMALILRAIVMRSKEKDS